MKSHRSYHSLIILTCIVVLVVGASGCIGSASNSDGDITVKNQDSVSHNMTIIIDRGPSYTNKNLSALISDGDEKQFTNVLPRTDTTYAFYLYVYIDEDYKKTTGHQWDQGIVFTIQNNANITVDKEEDVVEFTPETQNASDNE